MKTPSSHWREMGLPDPFGEQYQCKREELSMGNLTDDELANEMFVYDHRRGLESMAYLTAAKERIRWLSRRLSEVEKNQAELRTALVAFDDAGYGTSTNYHKQGLANDLMVEALGFYINEVQDQRNMISETSAVGLHLNTDHYYSKKE